jgi:hypothetical protein
MAAFDFGAIAELYPCKGRGGARSPVSYHRFETAAEAIRYAIEELPPALLNGAILEINEDRYHKDQIRAFYDSKEFPLTRRAVDERAVNRRKQG